MWINSQEWNEWVEEKKARCWHSCWVGHPAMLSNCHLSLPPSLLLTPNVHENQTSETLCRIFIVLILLIWVCFLSDNLNDQMILNYNMWSNRYTFVQLFLGTVQAASIHTFFIFCVFKMFRLDTMWCGTCPLRHSYSPWCVCLSNSPNVDGKRNFLKKLKL